jgi:Repeat of Unknown Function (DUF347)
MADVGKALSKVEAALAFWVIKIAATTLGETGGDTVTMTLEWSYLAATMLFLGLAYRACDYANSRRQSRRHGGEPDRHRQHQMSVAGVRSPIWTGRTTTR